MEIQAEKNTKNFDPGVRRWITGGILSTAAGIVGLTYGFVKSFSGSSSSGIENIEPEKIQELSNQVYQYIIDTYNTTWPVLIDPRGVIERAVLNTTAFEVVEMATKAFQEQASKKGSGLDGLAIGFFIGGASLMLLGGFLTNYYLVLSKKTEKDLRKYNYLLDLQKRLPEIQEEIRIKKEVIDKIDKLLSKLDRRFNFRKPLVETNPTLLKQFIVQALDSKDDLNLYVALNNILGEINKLSYLGTHKYIWDTVLELLKQRFVEKHYNDNQDELKEHVFAQSNLYDFLISMNDLKIYDSKQNRIFPIFDILSTFFEILSDQHKLFTLNTLAELFERKYGLKTSIDPLKFNCSIIKLLDDVLTEQANTEMVLKNANQLFDDAEGEKEQRMIAFLQERASLEGSYKSFKSFMANIKPEDLKSILEGLTYILSNEQVFNNIINQPKSGLSLKME